MERASTDYVSTDPQNGLRADELGQRWNADAERVLLPKARMRRERSQGSSANVLSKEAWVSLAQDLEKLWDYPEADVRLKRRIPRTWLEEAMVKGCLKAGEIRSLLHGQGGGQSELTQPRRRPRQNPLLTAATIVEAVKKLSRTRADDPIAAWLNQHQSHDGSGNHWTKDGAYLRSKGSLPAFWHEHRQSEGLMRLGQAATFGGLVSPNCDRHSKHTASPRSIHYPVDHGFSNVMICKHRQQ